LSGILLIISVVFLKIYLFVVRSWYSIESITCDSI